MFPRLATPIRRFSTRTIPYLKVKNDLGLVHIPTNKIKFIEEGATIMRETPYYELHMGETTVKVKEGNPAYSQVKKLIESWKRPPMAET
jgi:hypothetical protein